MLPNRRILFAVFGAVSAALLIFFARAQLAQLIRLLSGGAVIAYLFYPVSRWFSERFHMSRAVSIISAFLASAAALMLIVFLLLPPLIRQMRDLISALPSFADTARTQIRSLNSLLNERGFSRIALPDLEWERVLSSIPPLLGGTASWAGSIVSRFTEATLAFMLGYYFLRDRERLALHLELMIPASFRLTALRMTSAVHREISSFLRGQLLISLIVGVLSAVALLISGVRAFLALGLIVGIFNMIPYFGPLLGGIPAVLMALTQGPLTALFAALALFTVQQLDSLIISPRIMGALTGLHPGVVLLSITLGGSFAGVAGMLLAIPTALAVRAISREWAVRKSSV